MSTPATPKASISARISEKPHLQEQMKALLLSGQYSDMTIACQGFSFRVHRAIACSQSPFFRSAMDGDFKEGTTKIIDLPEDNLETIERVVAFLYIGDYSADGHLMDTGIRSPKLLPLEPESSAQAAITPSTPPVSGQLSDAVSKSEGQTHLQVYIAADKFQIEDLKSRASGRLKSWCEENWKSPALLEVVDDAVSACLDDDLGIRDIFAEVICKHITEFCGNPTVFESLCTASGKLSGAVIWHLVQEQTTRKQKLSAALDRLIKTANSKGRCTSCYSSINVKIVRDELLKDGIIRCRDCSTVL